MTDGNIATTLLALSAVATGVFLAGKYWGSRIAREAKIREHREARALLEITEAVNGSLDLHQVMSVIVRTVGDRVGAQRCSIVFADPSANRCFVMAASEDPAADMLEIDLAKYPEIRRAIETKEAVLVRDVDTDPLLAPVRELLMEQGYRSLVVMPLVYGKEVLGTLFLRASRETPFGAEEIRFCRIAAGASANALKNAMLYRDAAREAVSHRATGEKLRRVLDGTPDVVVAIDGQGIVTEFNRAAEELTGRFAREAIGRPIGDLLPPEVLDVEFGRKGREAALPRADGTQAELHFVSAPLSDPSGAQAGRVILGRDVTDLRRAEKSLAQAERLSSLGEVVAGVAHELNNPLSAVLGYAQLLQPGTGRDDLERDLSRIVESARRCQKIVVNLLSFARKHPAKKMAQDLNACVRKVVELKTYHLRASKIDVVFELTEPLPSACFDFHQLEQVILNLLNNAEQAIAATGRGGIVTLRSYVSGDDVIVEIEDDGPGIPPAVRHRVFDPFFTTKDVGMGTGLGLSVSYGIMQEHHGRIELRPARPNGGTCFAVMLPRAQGAAVAADRAAKPEVADKPLLGRRVLVAEDEPLVLDLFSRLLEQDGASVTLAHDGEEAWSRILETDFDVIVADLRMPNLDGRALYERVVEARPSMVRRFVFATGDLVRQESLKFLEGIPNRILAKPLDVDDVRRVLIQVVSASRPGFRPPLSQAT